MDVKSRILDQPSSEIYRNIEIRLTIPRLNIQIGQKHPDLDSFLIDNNVYTWAFVCQPASVMIEQIHKAKLRCTQGECVIDHTSLSTYPGILILDIPLGFATKLAKADGQSFLIFGELNRKAEIVYCHKI